MFTGIIECMGRVEALTANQSNLEIRISSEISRELRVDQSVSHDGVCLTVTAVEEDTHIVTAVQETLSVTTLSQWKVGDTVNLERALKIGEYLDGHFVQGHIDAVARCVSIRQEGGSLRIKFEYPEQHQALLIHKGSVCINGVSLTVTDVTLNQFSVAIIPYTLQHTTFQYLKPHKIVNVEFDVLGKYIQRCLNLSQANTK